MKRSQVEHVLRAAAAITQETSFFVIGSQAVLFHFPHAPEDLTHSRELDLYPAFSPEKADLIAAGYPMDSPPRQRGSGNRAMKYAK